LKPLPPEAGALVYQVDTLALPRPAPDAGLSTNWSILRRMTSGAPAWVSYAALGVSATAVLLSGVAARIAYLSYRASGPRLRLEAVYEEKDPSKRRIVMALTVINQGRGDVDIQGFHMTPYGGELLARGTGVDVTNLEGPDLPARLAGNSRITWYANVLPAAREYDAALRSGKLKPYSSWPSQFYFTVYAGSGKRAHDKSNQFDARQLIADAFPLEQTSTERARGRSTRPPAGSTPPPE
jgi:hypothetical protein